MIGIVDYKAGNLTSVKNAFDHMGIPSFISGEISELAKAQRIVFPGVGAAGAAMEEIHHRGLDVFLHEAVQKGTPVLGICIGTQIVMDHSDEDGGVDCLGILPGNVVRFASAPGIKIPHMGWNQVQFLNNHPVFAGIESGTHFYFVHSYYPVPTHCELILAQTTYGNQTFTSALYKKNLVCTQFHTEKSGDAGLQVLQNFARWDGLC
jgi:imidazole glycerol-phosphate synthase subunit HisH